MKKKTIIISIAFALVFVCILAYFLLPTKISLSNTNSTGFVVQKGISNNSCSYHLTEQETGDFIRILKDSKLFHDFSRPNSFPANQVINISVYGGAAVSLCIYYNENKTYVYARMSSNLNLNQDYRISNADEIRLYIEKLIENRKSEFKQIPSNEPNKSQ